MAKVKSSSIDWPNFPDKERLPKIQIVIESHKSDAKKDYVRVFVTDAVGGRNMFLPIEGKDLDASELTWAITKMLRQWLSLPI